MLLQVPHFAKFSKGSYSFLAVCFTSLTEDEDDDDDDDEQQREVIKGKSELIYLHEISSQVNDCYKSRRQLEFTFLFVQPQPAFCSFFPFMF